VDSITQSNEAIMKITIELEIETDDIPETPDAAIKEAVYQYLIDLIDDDSLDFVVKK
jgi:hypothetical protein